MNETCNECAKPVAEDDASPSCGAHVIHEWCAEFFPCRECYRERRALRMWVA